MRSFKNLILLIISFTYQSFIFAASQFENIAPVLLKEQTDEVWTQKTVTLRKIEAELIFKEEALQQGPQRVDLNQFFAFPTQVLSELERKLDTVKKAPTLENRAKTSES